jgi:hypothetical protein
MNIRRIINQTASLAPMPIMLLGAVSSYFHTSNICGMTNYEMTVMWLAMAFAHVGPWLFYYQSKKILPVKQQ